LEELLRMEHISKRFGDFYANHDVNLSVAKGEVHTLLGENGAGKSTLMNILIGLYQPTEGSIFLNGRQVRIESPSQAVKLGIGMVHQHFMLVEAMTVFENMILGDRNSKGIFIDREARRKEILALSEKYGLDVELDKLITEISVGAQQRVEILKALYHGAELLILDEPSAALTDIEVEGLFAIMKKLVSEGKSIIFISHKMREVLHISDRITILRAGEVVTTVDAHSVTGQELANMMIGRELQQSQYEKKDVEAGAVISLQNIDYHKESKHAGLNDVSLSIGRGEIVGIAGVDGNGQTELVNAITGLGPVADGKITLCGQDITHASVSKRIAAGISHIPEDRQRRGLVLDFTLEENIVLGRCGSEPFSAHGVLKHDAMRAYADRIIEQYDVRCGEGARSKAGGLSGGNQQKAIVGREIERPHELLIAFQPIRGMDVGSIEYIHNRLLDERSRGKAVLLVSLELDEVLQLSDRILAINQGRLIGEVSQAEATESIVGHMMAGMEREAI